MHQIVAVMPPKNTIQASPSILATSQQSRFHMETLNAAVAEIDLKQVSVSIGQNELVTDSRLKLKEGVRYALVGR